jgi:colanic acid/amylovoran biosynthesis protein
MRIVITGVTGLKSRGTDALVTTICQQLRLRFPDADLHVLTPTPDFDSTRLAKMGVITDQNRLHALRSLTGRVRLALSCVNRRLSVGIQVTKELLRSADLVVCTGGDIFSSDYGSFDPFLVPLREALSGGAKVVQHAMSIGPFKTEVEVNQWRAVASQSSLITTREQRTYDYLTQKLGLPSSQVYRTADPAFLLAPPSNAVVKDMAIFYGLKQGAPTIAFAPSHGVSMYSKTDYANYMRVWEGLVRHAVEKMGVQALLIPHVQRDEVIEDDCILCTEIVRRCGFNPAIRMASGDLTGSELKGLISTCDLVVAERMHAAIAGLSSGRPTALVGYSIKAFGVAGDLFGEEQSDGTHVIPVKDFLRDDGTAKKWMESRWADRERTGELIRKNLPEVRARAHKSFDLIADLFKPGAKPA